jgi:hypothetical protein
METIFPADRIGGHTKDIQRRDSADTHGSFLAHILL